MSTAELAPLSPEEIRELVAIGYHAALNGQAAKAQKLFEALAHVRPGAPFVFIGQALALMAQGQAGEAASLLNQKAREANPNDSSILVFLGLALRLSQLEHQSRQILTHALEQQDTDEAMRALARQILDGEAKPLTLPSLPHTL